jgi:dipeptidyl aminopeptidase/acylaminoacyl peptidase
VHDRAATRKGERLHVLDPATGALREILADTGYLHRDKPAPALAEAAMARKFPFVYRASDGLPVHGFVLVPPGVDVSRAPLIAHVHGGTVRLVPPRVQQPGQLLANRGYVVFESNFRGSTASARPTMRAGKGDYGNGRVQRDIVERAGLAGAGHRRSCAGGDRRGSFGGYSALQGVTFQPDLFKVGVAAVPPADLGWVVRWYSRSVDQMTPGIPLSTSMCACWNSIRRSRGDGTPARAVAHRERRQAGAPRAVDRRRRRRAVPIRSVMHFAAALSAKGKDVSLLVDPEGRHQVSDPDTREAYMFLAVRLLQRRLAYARRSRRTGA